jgi:hypothetical protein
MKSFPTRGAVPAALVVALGVTLCGCATITRSPTTNWRVSSFPAGAQVTTTNGGYCDATPCSLLVRRKDHFVATLTKPGYEPGVVEVKPEIKPIGAVAFLGNGLYGGLIGASIDIYTGAPLDPSHNGELIQLKAATGRDAIGSQDATIRLGAVADGCSPDKAAYARQIGVPCEALSQRVTFNPGPLQTASR